MTWPSDENGIEYGPPEEPEDTRRGRSLIVGAVVLAIIGSGSAFAWRAYGRTPYPTFDFGSSTDSAEPQTVGVDEFRAYQQKIAEQTQANAQAWAAQQADVKRLSEQMAAVSAKVDALQSAISSARAAMPAAAPARPKKPAPKPAARISTGGAPLPLEPTH